MLDERVSEERSLDAAAEPRDERRRRPSDVEVCVTRAPEPSGAIMITRVAGEAALEQSVMADGVSHPVAHSDCRGTQSATWSRDGRRLFASAELTCGEDRRKVSGLTMLEDPLTWLDIQSIEVGDRTEVRLRRYTRPAQAQPGGSSTPAGPVGRAVWSVDDVVDATARLTPAVLEAALVETHAHVGLNSRSLVALDDAGVSDTVIDLLVALAYPDKFLVESRTEADRGTFFFTESDIEHQSAPWFYSPLFSRAYYAPFGYYYAPYYAFSPFVTLPPAVIVIDGETPADPGRGDGRVINGLGYTRVRPRDASARGDQENASAASSTGAASGGGATMSPAGASQNGSSGGGGAAPSGGLGGSSDGEDARLSPGKPTAQPR